MRWLALSTVVSGRLWVPRADDQQIKRVVNGWESGTQTEYALFFQIEMEQNCWDRVETALNREGKTCVGIGSRL